MTSGAQFPTYSSDQPPSGVVTHHLFPSRNKRIEADEESLTAGLPFKLSIKSIRDWRSKAQASFRLPKKAMAPKFKGLALAAKTPKQAVFEEGLINISGSQKKAEGTYEQIYRDLLKDAESYTNSEELKKIKNAIAIFRDCERWLDEAMQNPGLIIHSTGIFWISGISVHFTGNTKEQLFSYVKEILGPIKDNYENAKKNDNLKFFFEALAHQTGDCLEKRIDSFFDYYTKLFRQKSER